MRKVRLMGILLLSFALLTPIIFLNIYEYQNSSRIHTITDNLISNKLYPGVLDSTSETPWVRENVFLNDNLFLQQGFGYQLNNYHDEPLKDNPNSYKVLLFGDSFTWGNGNPDWADNIGNLLERELNASSQSNIFKVITFGRNGKSIYSHYDLFNNYSLIKIEPEMVIYNFYVNDPIPSFNEALICGERQAKDCNLENPATNPVYQKCLRGDGSEPAKLINRLRASFPLSTQGLLTRYCDPKLKKLEVANFNFGEILLNPTKSPYYKSWLDTLPLLQEVLAPYPIHVANFYSSPVHAKANQTLIQDMVKSGYSIIPMKETLKIVGDKILPREEEEILDAKLMINPGNTHSSPYLNQLYARDMAKYIMENLKEKAYDRAKESAVAFISSRLVTHTMPTFAVKVKSDDNADATVTFKKEGEKLYDQKIGEGKPLPFQYANCLNLGYSNFQIMLAKGLSGKLRIQGLDPKIKTKLGFYYYDSEHLRRYLPL